MDEEKNFKVLTAEELRDFSVEELGKVFEDAKKLQEFLGKKVVRLKTQLDSAQESKKKLGVEIQKEFGVSEMVGLEKLEVRALAEFEESGRKLRGLIKDSSE